MQQKIQTEIYQSPVGDLILGSFEDQLCLCDWQYRKMRNSIDKRIQAKLKSVYELRNSPIINETKEQLTEYFNGTRTSFDLPMLWVGTEFQKSVWKALMNIPFGKTETYLELSKTLGNEKAIRAVAAANGANAISIIVPCHRIIGSRGELVAYAGGLSAKRKLLELENPRKTEQLTLF
jgi:methylated-DNA-[protein]-cysteine S-methyltransferase